MSRIIPAMTRREALIKTTTLSAAGLAVLTGLSARAFATDAVTMPAQSTMGTLPASPTHDAELLNVALGLENEVIAAYQIGIDSGLLQQPALNVALLFQSHHKAHRDELSSAVQKLGGTPVSPEGQNDYAKTLNAASLKSQSDILDMVTKLEFGAANAYIGAIPSFTDHPMAKLAARLLADEAMHWTALLAVQQKPMPVQALAFGS